MSSDPNFLCALLLVLLVATYNVVTALECYECNSHTDPGCENSVPPSLMKQRCSVKHTFCRKVWQLVDVVSVDGTPMPPDARVIRSCGWVESKYQDQCYERFSFGVRQTVCSCYGDNCNGSPSSRYSLSLGHLLLATIPAIFAKMLIS